MFNTVSNNFESENPKEDITNFSGPMIVDFFATWCGPCKMLSPVLERVHEKYGDSLKILKVDIDKHEELARKYEVMSVPTLFFYLNGEVVSQRSGFISENDLCDIIESQLMKKI